MININNSILEKVDFNENDFDIIETLKQGKMLFEDYYDIKSSRLTYSFDENLWKFEDLIEQNIFHFDFHKFISLISFNKKINIEEFILALKSWTIFNLSCMSPSISYKQFNYLYSIALFTKGFTSNFRELDELVKDQRIYSNNQDKNVSFSIKKVTPETTSRFINSLINFNNFYNRLFIEPIIITNLISSEQLLKSNRKTRLLPNPKEFLNFKDALEQYYYELNEKNIGKNYKELISFYPLVLWWDITSIIPMRPSEFCMIRRDCLTQDNKFTFPRFKQKRNNKESREMIIYDTLPIPISIIKKIEHYKELTSPYGDTETLISLPSIVKCSLKIIKGNVDYSNKHFTIKYLRLLLGYFYEDIVTNKYGIEVQEKIKVGDLRHIAIISMMLQGFDRVEIERLAGHIDLNTQYSYSNHMHFMVDTEIQNLTNQFAIQNSKDFISPKAIEEYEELIDKTIINQLYEDISKDDYIELEMGFCKDSSMPCPTFNWSHTGCYFCKYWGITEKELYNNKDKIISEISLLFNDLHRKVNYLVGLYNLHNFNEIAKLNPQLKIKLKNTSQEIQNDTAIMAKINYMFGGILINEESRQT